MTTTLQHGHPGTDQHVTTKRDDFDAVAQIVCTCGDRWAVVDLTADEQMKRSGALDAAVTASALDHVRKHAEASGLGGVGSTWTMGEER